MDMNCNITYMGRFVTLSKLIDLLNGAYIHMISQRDNPQNGYGDVWNCLSIWWFSFRTLGKCGHGKGLPNRVTR